MRSRFTRAITGAMVSGLLLTGVIVLPATAASAVSPSRWRSCDNQAAGIVQPYAFYAPAKYYGKGKYQARVTIKWKYQKGTDRWGTGDTYKSESKWYSLKSKKHLKTSIEGAFGDRTVWGNVYYRLWKAEVTIKLYKDRKGPIDKKVVEHKYEFYKGRFKERGSDCGTMF